MNSTLESPNSDKYVLYTPGLGKYSLATGTTEASARSIATKAATRHGVAVTITRGAETIAVCEPTKS